jgi:hypothetical protein
MAGAPIVVGLTAQALFVRLENDYLRVSAPNMEFLTDKPLERLKDGNTVGYLGQLTVSTGDQRILQGRSIAHFAFSYDIWTERFKVTLLTPQLSSHELPPSARNLTRAAAQAWCLDQLKIDLAHVPADRAIWVRLEIRSEDARETAGIVGEPGISLSGLIALFSHPPKNQQVHKVEEISLKISDLRKPRI